MSDNLGTLGGITVTGTVEGNSSTGGPGSSDDGPSTLEILANPGPRLEINGEKHIADFTYPFDFYYGRWIDDFDSPSAIGDDPATIASISQALNSLTLASKQSITGPTASVSGNRVTAEFSFANADNSFDFSLSSSDDSRNISVSANGASQINLGDNLSLSFDYGLTRTNEDRQDSQHIAATVSFLDGYSTRIEQIKSDGLTTSSLSLVGNFNEDFLGRIEIQRSDTNQKWSAEVRYIAEIATVVLSYTNEDNRVTATVVINY